MLLDALATDVFVGVQCSFENAGLMKTFKFNLF